MTERLLKPPKDGGDRPPEALRAEEAILRKMLKARTLSPDVAQAALDALAIKRRKAASILDRKDVTRQSRRVLCSNSRPL